MKLSAKPRGRAARPAAAKSNGQAGRKSLSIQGAREHNLQNISLEIPRDQLVVVTGLSGSGKSSLAFDTIYAEGQRRYMESLSSYAKRFIAQVHKPDVDFMFGLSPVISIEQKTIARNPRSTVGTMTDINSYLNLLMSTIGQAHCPRCRSRIAMRTPGQVLEQIMGLPAGTTIELRAPVWKVYGEDYSFLFTEIRKKGYRRLQLDGKAIDLADEPEIDASVEHEMDVLVDRFVIAPGIDKQLMVGIQNALALGEGFLSVRIAPGGKAPRSAEASLQSLGCEKHRLVAAGVTPDYFMFNAPLSACRTCLGLGTYMQVHPDLLVPDKTRSILDGCFVREAFHYEPDSWGGRMMYSLSRHLKFGLDVPWGKLSERVRQVLLHGSPTKFALVRPPGAKVISDGSQKAPGYERHVGQQMAFGGIAAQIERRYKWYRQKQVANTGMEAWLEKVMVEHTCPDCQGTRLKATRQLFTIQGKTLHEIGQINFAELRGFLDSVTIPPSPQQAAGRQILKEVAGRLELLLGIGLDYLNFNRRSSTLSGGESQRIRLSTQIGSGLMGMLYVLDEPSIGLHPRDNGKMIATLRRLRDLGNTVIVVEHDEDTIRAADHVVEMGPGPGVHGGRVVTQGTLDDVLACRASPTGQYLSGARTIRTPDRRRTANGQALVVRGARENNLRSIDVTIPLRQFVCITGASGSGKSTLINEILHKRLCNALYDSRVLFGAHDRLDGIELINNVVSIDQSPIGRNSRSNPATYIGFYDDIRVLFAQTEQAKQHGFRPGRFSFNVKTGRCPECQGEGTITTKLYFMPDVEVPCESCKGARFNPQTLEVTYKGKTIADVLNMSIEQGVSFFADRPSIGRRVALLDDLGLGYITLGQSSTTLSGGEAQRIKLAGELGRLRRGEHTLYILDEPTTGLHLADIARLLDCLNRLVEAGHTVLVIEHHLDVIKQADHVIDLGPEGGHKGGEVIATGTPEQIARSPRSHTGRYLKAHL
jgi:excinuclease ABC subunit A